VESPTLLPVCERADEETVFDILDSWETVWEKTGHDIPAEDACRAWLRLDLLEKVKEGMEALRAMRKVLPRVEAFLDANPQKVEKVGWKPRNPKKRRTPRKPI
jgi:hypothetical protein